MKQALNLYAACRRLGMHRVCALRLAIKCLIGTLK